MNTNYYIGLIVGALIAIFFGAYIAKFMTGRLAAFKPSYLRALISTVIAYFITAIFGLALRRFGVLKVGSHSPQILIGSIVLACTHINLLRSDTGVRLSAGKAVIVAICQSLGVLPATLLGLFVIVSIMRIFT